MGPGVSSIRCTPSGDVRACRGRAEQPAEDSIDDWLFALRVCWSLKDALQLFQRRDPFGHKAEPIALQREHFGLLHKGFHLGW